MLPNLVAVPILLHATGPLLDLAYTLAVQVGTSIYDGLFLGLAVQLDGRLVTADRPLFDKSQASPHATRVCWVEDAP